MIRLLKTKSKQSVRKAFGENVLYQTIKAAYKQQETEMQTLGFSPEEIWINSIAVFDCMLKDVGKIEEMTQSLWDDIFCELRDEANDIGRKFENAELEAATSCILNVVCYYMMATNNYDDFIRYIPPIKDQINRHSQIEDIGAVDPLEKNTKKGFVLHIQEYIAQGIYVSDTFDAPDKARDPIKPMLKPADRQEAKNKIRKRIDFMNGVTDKGRQIMSSGDFSKMIEAVEYLMENNVVKKQNPKIYTNLANSSLRYTFYLVFKNEGKCIGRQLWIAFLVETFSQMKNSKDSLYNHFSEKSNAFPYNNSKKRK